MKFIWKKRYVRLAKRYVKNKNNVGNSLPDIKTSYNTITLRSIYFWHYNKEQKEKQEPRNRSNGI